MNTRELIVEILLEILEKEKYSHLVIRDVLQKYDYLDSRDKAFIKRVADGCVEWKIKIDYIINQFSKVKVERQKPLIRTILRMSVYQLMFMDNIPDSAVCNEAVKLCKKRGFQNLQGFVNGVLRNIARNKEQIEYPDREKDIVEFLSVEYSMPTWIVEKFIEEQGEEIAEKILAGFMEIEPVTIRMNENADEESVESLVNEWKKCKVEVGKHPYLSYAYCLKGIDGVRNLPGFEDGLYTVQDVSSMLVCEAAGLKKGDKVIDVCAAPGGKAIHAAQKVGKEGIVSARDLTEYKTSYIKENIERMKIENCEVLIWDAREVREEDIGTADVVIADLPCSGLGVMGKKKDIKYRISKESLDSLVKLQREILDAVHKYVKPGGILLYSTCTINKQENEDNVTWLTENYSFETESLSAYLPDELKAGEDGVMQLLPGIHETDGFFIARLRKKA